MRSALFVLVLALFANVALSASVYDCAEEKRIGHRVRHEFRKLENADRRLFIDALLTLKNTMIPDPRDTSAKPRNMSKYDMIVREHNDLNRYPHFTSLFFPWHRRYLLFLEDSLRALGGKFQCVTLPYWDWTKDASHQTASPLLQNSDYSFGGSGDSRKKYCLSEGPFAGWTSANPSRGCLKRQFNTPTNFVTPAALWDIIRIPDYYLASKKGFWTLFEGFPHANPHVFIGGSAGDMSIMWSPSDPLFWMHHAMVDLTWSIWMDCHGHDNVPISQITDTSKIYYAAIDRDDIVLQDVLLDQEMHYGNLNITGVTARMMHDITAWNYAYEQNVDLISTSTFATSVCKFDYYTTTKSTRDVSSSVKPSANMELANNMWNELQQVSVSAEARLGMLALGECQAHKAFRPSYLPATNYTNWLSMGGKSSATAFVPLC